MKLRKAPGNNLAKRKKRGILGQSQRRFFWPTHNRNEIPVDVPGVGEYDLPSRPKSAFAEQCDTFHGFLGDREFFRRARSTPGPCHYKSSTSSRLEGLGAVNRPKTPSAFFSSQAPSKESDALLLDS